MRSGLGLQSGQLLGKRVREMEVHARQGKEITGPKGVLHIVLASCTGSDTVGAVVERGSKGGCAAPVGPQSRWTA